MLTIKQRCEGYQAQKKCRRKAAFRHVSEHGVKGGFSYVIRVSLCSRCSEQFDALIAHDALAPFIGPVRPGIARQ